MLLHPFALHPYAKSILARPESVAVFVGVFVHIALIRNRAGHDMDAFIERARGALALAFGGSSARRRRERTSASAFRRIRSFTSFTFVCLCHLVCFLFRFVYRVKVNSPQKSRE